MATKYVNKEAGLTNGMEEEERDDKDGGYDLNQIHDLGFTLSPKPFNLKLTKRN